MKWRIAQWLELRWWQWYLRGRDKQAYYQWKKKYWEKLLYAVSKHLPAANEVKHVADLGCGPAGIFIALPYEYVTAVDPLLEKYENSLVPFDRHDFPTVNFVCTTMEEFLTSEKMDVVFCLNAINHVRDIARAFDALGRITKPQGKLVLGIDVHNYALLKWIFRAVPGDALHPQQFDANEYKQFLLKRNWKIVDELVWKQEAIFNYVLLVAERNG